MRRTRLLLGVALAAAVGCAREPTALAPATSPPPAEEVASGPPAAVVGTAGCAARGCHGSLDATPNAVDWKSAATGWLKWDKHGRAFAALETQRSADIIARLGPGWASAPTEARCLACHTVPVTAGRTDPEAKRLHADGVGCEACHTAPGWATGEWLTAHWQPGGVETCFANGSLRRLNAAADRAAVCVGCHVGAVAADGVPVREVNHDLIAAGHPRLNFDLLTFLELLPPHWPSSRDKDAGPVAWQAGQVEASRAALTLAADRADRAADGKAPWPELADRNCFACHHRLSPGPAKPAWTSPLVSVPFAHLLGWGAEELKSLTTGNPAKAAAALRGLRERVKPVPIDKTRLTAAVSGGDWDACAQGYYALRAADRPAEPLARLAEVLKLPRGPDVANSPVGFDAAQAAKRLAATR